MKNGLLYHQSKQGQIQETVLQCVVSQIHRNAALDGCHHEAAHQGQSRSLSLMQEQFWWPGMASDLRNRIRKCGHCKKFEAAPPIAPLTPRSTQTGTPATGASGRHQDGAQPTSDWGRKRSISNQGGKTSTSSQGGKTSTSSQGVKTSTPCQSSKPASTGRGEKPTASGGLVDLPLEKEGVDNGAWTDWYQRTLRGAKGGISEPQGPPYLIRMAQARREAIGQIYNSKDGKDPPPHNIASEALWAYYSGVDPQTLKTWACQILCMISEYHMACMTRGSPVTSPILPGVIKNRLPPLTDYTSPEDRSGMTNVQVRNHQARTL